MDKFYKLIKALREWLTCPMFGFVQGHAYLTQSDLVRIQNLIGKSDQAEVAEFESRFAAIVGDGRAVSYAAGRMGFYSLMKTLGIGGGDEVVLLGSTCSVMVNAVLRARAMPVFSDTDPDTFGSSAEAIQKCITPRTRMIVVQHSFGIPCDIRPIVKLSRVHEIFLLEDCAISLGSSFDGIQVGNFGDAALFSSDHLKPINTLTGGLIYTRDAGLFHKLRDDLDNTPELPLDKQRALWNRLLIERQYCNPSKYGRMKVMDYIMVIKKILLKQDLPFLYDDFHATPGSSYPYPARLPAFLAAVGLHEIQRWPQTANDRKEILKELIKIAQNSEIGKYLPKAYFNPKLDIIPLRFSWTQPDGADMRDRLSDFVYVTLTWFMQPIIATQDPLEQFGYVRGACPISEKAGMGMVNLPCNLSRDASKHLAELFHNELTSTLIH